MESYKIPILFTILLIYKIIGFLIVLFKFTSRIKKKILLKKSKIVISIKIK